jgi:hypothetical protein
MARSQHKMPASMKLHTELTGVGDPQKKISKAEKKS